MTRKPARFRAVWAFYAISLGLHALLGVGAVIAPEKSKPSEAVAIALQEIHEAQKAQAPPPPPPPPKPPPPRPPPPKEEPKPEAEAKEEARADDSADSDPSRFEDLGLLPGGDAGGPGVAVAMNHPHEKAAPRQEVVRRKVASLGPKPGDCSDPPVKPRALKVVKPEYTENARQAEIEGIVRVEVVLDETGKVLAARVLNGLGHGLDENAIRAAQAIEWSPATQCGKPVKFTYAFTFRFTLDS